jgi:hypothetical protein
MAPSYVQGCDTKKKLRWGSLVMAARFLQSITKRNSYDDGETS